MSLVPKWGQALLFKQLEQSAKVSKDEQDQTKWNYTDRLSADRLSLLLQKVGISEPTTARKAITIEKDNSFSLIITKEDLQTIESRYTFYYTLYRSTREELTKDPTSKEFQDNCAKLDSQTLQEAEKETDEELSQYKYGPAFGTLTSQGVTLASSNSF